MGVPKFSEISERAWALSHEFAAPPENADEYRTAAHGHVLRFGWTMWQFMEGRFEPDYGMEGKVLPFTYPKATRERIQRLISEMLAEIHGAELQANAGWKARHDPAVRAVIADAMEAPILPGLLREMRESGALRPGGLGDLMRARWPKKRRRPKSAGK